jgi:membrane-bound lytic murein transglycosylase D
MLPIENVEQFAENLTRSPLNNKIHWFHYRFKTGDTLALVAKKFNTSIASIRKMNHLRTNPQHGYDLLIPYNSASATAPEAIEQIAAREENKRERSLVFSNREKQVDDSVELGASFPLNYSLRPGDTIYMVRHNDSLKSIANRFHVTPQTILAVNHLKNQTLTPGSQLIVPAHPLANNNINHTITKKNNGPLQPGDTIYMVRRGDTIEQIAARYKTTASAIRVANLMINNSLEEGDRLIIPTHVRG